MSLPSRPWPWPAMLLAGVVAAAGFAGSWGSVGPGDGRLYRQIAACTHADAGSALRACLRSEASGSLLPVAALGWLGRAQSADASALRGLVRGAGVLLAILCALLVYGLARSPGRRRDGVLAAGALLAATGLLDRARSGGPEIWTLATLLGLAWLLRRPGRSLLIFAATLLVAAMAVAAHPYAAPALLLLVLCRAPQTPPAVPGRTRGRLWLGWLDGAALAAALGGLALFVAVWGDRDPGAFLWHRLSDLYRADHPPLRIAGQTWVQGMDLASPPLWTTPVLLFLTTPLPYLILALAGIGSRMGRRDVPSTASFSALGLLLLGWTVIQMLQGSPVADGQDHRVVLLGLCAPFVGPGLRVSEGALGALTTFLSPRAARWLRAEVATPVLVLLALLPAGIASTRGEWPGSGLAATPAGLAARGLSIFPRPLFEPALIDALGGLEPGAAVACSPWELPCDRDIVPGLAALGLGPPRLHSARYFNATVVVLPQDPTYATPPVLLQDLSGAGRYVADVKAWGWLRYAVRRIR